MPFLDSRDNYNTFNFDGSTTTNTVVGSVSGPLGKVYYFTLNLMFGNYVSQVQPQVYPAPVVPTALPQIPQGLPVFAELAFSGGANVSTCALISQQSLINSTTNSATGAVYTFVTPNIPVGSGTYVINYYYNHIEMNYGRDYIHIAAGSGTSATFTP